MGRSIAKTIRRTRIALTALFTLAFALLAAFGSATPAAAADAAVAIDDFTFTPLALTIPVGTRVVWTNQQPGVAHTITSDTGVWDSGTLQTGATFAFTFTQVGTFAYHCVTHPTMQGSVTVIATASAAQLQAAPAVAGPGTPVIPSGLPRTGGGGEALHESRGPMDFFLSLLALAMMFVSINVFISKRARR